MQLSVATDQLCHNLHNVYDEQNICVHVQIILAIKPSLKRKVT